MKINKPIILFTLLLVNIGFGSRFWGMISSPYHSLGLDGGNWFHVENSLDEFRSQSVYHTTSWGLMYYINGKFNIEVPVITNGIGPIHRVEGSANGDTDYDFLLDEIYWGGADSPDILTDDVNCSIAHLRLATVGAIDVPNPHPFIMYYPSNEIGSENNTWSFAHNGTLNREILREIITDEWMENNVEPQTYGENNEYGSNEYGGDWHDTTSTGGWQWVVDSELYFFWLMKNIMEEPDGDVLRGIHKALSHSTFFNLTNPGQYDDNQHANFVLSNGKEIWAFRRNGSDVNSDGEENSTNYAHTLYWHHETEWDRDYKAVMSQTTEEEWEDLSDHSLIYLPGNGTPVKIANFDRVNHVSDIESKYFNEDWNWVGFPRLIDNDGTPKEEVFSLATEYLTDLVIINIEDEQSNWYGSYNYWSEGGISQINSKAGYKVKIQDNYTLHNIPIIGSRIPADTQLDLVVDNNWVHYFLTEPQHPSDAFPQEVLDNMTSILTDDWFMIRRDGEFYVKVDCPLQSQGSEGECFTLNYGEMVIVIMDQAMPFTWNVPDNSAPILPNKPLLVEHFTYNEKKDYIPVIIESIESNYNIDQILEIAGKIDDNYVGAEVVYGFPINLRIYESNLSGLTFEALIKEDDLGRQGESNEDMVLSEKVLGIKNINFENGAVLLDLVEISNETIESPKIISFVNAFPNPFNPSIDIIFSLNIAAEVDLSIYNILGGKIATLMQGNLMAGNYTCPWNGMTMDRKPVASGVYYYRLQSGDEVIINKVLLLK